MGTTSQLEPVWLVSKGHVLAAAVRATSRADRRRGLIGVRTVEQPLVLQPCSWIHTVGMRTAIDVAYVSHDGIVLSLSQMKTWRIGAPVRGSHFVVEAAPHSFERWNLHVGDEVEVRNVEQ
jgi:uncharacterized membrane protein (UPF0127 family)